VVRRGLILLVAWALWAGGCYATTPHRAEVAAVARPNDCTAAVEDVFSRSGFIEVQTPANLSMLFSPRVVGPYSPFLGTGVGVGVTIAQVGTGTCHVTLEALSPDAGCAEEHAPLSCGGMGEVRTTAVPGAGPASLPPNHLADGPDERCPFTPPPMCTLSYAPGNDATIDELARRVREALSPRVSVN
jgi:hypothetical protein